MGCLNQPATKHHRAALSLPLPGWGKNFRGKSEKPVGWDKNSLISMIFKKYKENIKKNNGGK